MSLSAVLKARLDQVITDGTIAKPSDPVWKEIADLCGAVNGKAVYTRVKLNRKIDGVAAFDLLRVSREEQCFSSDDSSESQCNSSDDSDADPSVAVLAGCFSALRCM